MIILSGNKNYSSNKHRGSAKFNNTKFICTVCVREGLKIMMKSHLVEIVRLVPKKLVVVWNAYE